MKNKTMKLAALVLSATMALSLAACGSSGASTDKTQDTQAASEAVSGENVQTETTAEEPTEEASEIAVDTSLDVRLAVLGGATGYGAAKLINDNDAGESTLHYTVTVETSPKVIQEGLIAEEYDIAALSSNKAALLASKTGSVQVAAVNTLGVMYLITSDGTAISSFEDLKGMTVSIPEEPSYILQALLDANGVASDVAVETYATPSDLLAAVVSGEVTCAVLPEPLLSTAMVKKEGVQVQMSLTEEWNKAYPNQELIQGCVVVRSAWAQEHPAELAAFLEEYESSINYVKDNAQDASAMVETWFGTPAAVAAKAIPNCNMTFLSGQEMKDALVPFYEVLSTIATSNIGETVPEDSFYYIGE